MLFIRSLLLLVALLSPAFGQDGSQIAPSAKDAVQALKLYLEGVSKSGGRPDYTKPPASELTPETAFPSYFISDSMPFAPDNWAGLADPFPSWVAA